MPDDRSKRGRSGDSCQHSIDKLRAGTLAKCHARSAVPPGPRGLPFLGSLLEVKRDRLGFLTNLTEDFGDVVMFRMGPKPVYFINCPDGVRRVLRDNYRNYKKGLGLIQARPLIGEGLLTSEGELWQRQRRMARPAFEQGKVCGYAPAINSALKAMFARWDAAWERDSGLSILSEMSRLTLDILIRCLFGIDFAYRAQTVETAFRVATEHAIHRMTALFEVTGRFPTPRNLRFFRALRDLDEVVHELIANRRNSIDKPPDLLSELLRARDEKGSEMSDKQIRDEIMTILLAGHETTACTLAWVWYLLAKNPVAEKKLRQECEFILSGREVAADDLPKFTYVNLVLRETMRLYPAVWLIPRRSIHSDVVASFTIPACTDVIISPYTLHRHRAHWHRPHEFLPERFEAIMPEGHDSDFYIPFGAGPRACVGQSMALLEAQLIILSITQKYRLSLLHDCKIDPIPLLTLRPATDVTMRLQLDGPEDVPMSDRPV